MTAQQLAERTRELGYPITRVAISKIEGNLRAGKLDVAELLVLAVALDIPPALLLFPAFPDGTLELLPGYDARVPKALDWLSGNAPLPVQIHADGTFGETNSPNNGTELVEAVALLMNLDERLADLHSMEQASGSPPEAVESIRRVIETFEQQLPLVKRDISEAAASLWGISAEDASDG